MDRKQFQALGKTLPKKTTEGDERRVMRAFAAECTWHILYIDAVLVWLSQSCPLMLCNHYTIPESRVQI